jgi:arylsulfatase A-like enzyme
VRTATHKLIYYWRKDQWELFDLVQDPQELKNLYDDPARQSLVAELKRELYRLKRELKDEDQFADEQPTTGVDGPAPAKKPPGKASSIRRGRRRATLG